MNGINAQQQQQTTTEKRSKRRTVTDNTANSKHQIRYECIARHTHGSHVILWNFINALQSFRATIISSHIVGLVICQGKPRAATVTH